VIAKVNSFLSSDVQVKGLFLDYDGTIAPLNVPRSQSAVSRDKLSILNRISAKIPIAVISTKDLAFLVKRTPFAHGWSGLGGLETKIGNTIVSRIYTQEQVFQLRKALDYVRPIISSANEIMVEEKRDSNGTAVAFSVDWRQAKDIGKAKNQAVKIFAYCETLPLTVIRYEQQPFFDVFPCPIDKGKALLEMKTWFGLTDGILYLGDSVVDNSAFQATDIAVAVVSDGTADNLICNYFVKFDDLPVFLEDLFNHSFQFNINLSKLFKNH
jgi:HAD superfamily hydrolase (TIGR01484 family)